MDKHLFWSFTFFYLFFFFGDYLLTIELPLPKERCDIFNSSSLQWEKANFVNKIGTHIFATTSTTNSFWAIRTPLLCDSLGCGIKICESLKGNESGENKWELQVKLWLNLFGYSSCFSFSWLKLVKINLFGVWLPQNWARMFKLVEKANGVC